MKFNESINNVLDFLSRPKDEQKLRMIKPEMMKSGFACISANIGNGQETLYDDDIDGRKTKGFDLETRTQNLKNDITELDYIWIEVIGYFDGNREPSLLVLPITNEKNEYVSFGDFVFDMECLTREYKQYSVLINPPKINEEPAYYLQGNGIVDSTLTEITFDKSVVQTNLGSTRLNDESSNRPLDGYSYKKFVNNTNTKDFNVVGDVDSFIKAFALKNDSRANVKQFLSGK